jgi:hypothetical protein
LKKAAGISLAVVLLAGTAGLALAATNTKVHIYKPFNSTGKPVGRVTHTYTGSCIGGSDASRRSDTWRCIVSGSTIVDPCFSSPKAKGIVLCPARGPWNSRVIKVKLNSKLPSPNKGKPSTHGLPWALVTVNGLKCQLNTGATRTVNGKRENYFCKGTTEALYGSPQRGSEPWKIYLAGGQAKHLSKKTAIRKAWF